VLGNQSPADLVARNMHFSAARCANFEYAGRLFLRHSCGRPAPIGDAGGPTGAACTVRRPDSIPSLADSQRERISNFGHAQSAVRHGVDADDVSRMHCVGCSRLPVRGIAALIVVGNGQPTRSGTRCPSNRPNAIPCKTFFVDGRRASSARRGTPRRRSSRLRPREVTPHRTALGTSMNDSCCDRGVAQGPAVPSTLPYCAGFFTEVLFAY
jgi:hypothetical protein